MWERSVFSSMATAIGYDEETSTLFITWNNGKRSAYADVPEQVAEQLSRAPSVGSMILQDIKPFFKHLGYR